MGSEQVMLYGCALAILFGVFGQSLRAVVGLKKQADVASASQKALKDVFSWTTLGVSLFIGAVAGVAGYLSLRFGSGEVVDFNESSTVLGIIAAGYAGTDFIEGFMKKYLPGS